MHSQSILRIANRCLVVPAISLCVIAGMLPMIIGTVLSFYSTHENGSLSFGSLNGYRTVFAGGRVEEFVTIVIRALVATGATLFVSIPAAYWLSTLRSGLQTGVLALFVTPWLVSDMLRAFGWQQLLSPVGPLSIGWNYLTNLGPLEGLRYNFGSVVVGLISGLLPAGLLSVFAAIPDHTRSEWLAARELGESRHVFRIMALGRSIPGISLGAVAVFILSCFASAEPLFLDGPTQTSIQTIAASLVNDGIPALLAFSTLLLGFVACTFAAAWGGYYVLSQQCSYFSKCASPLPRLLLRISSFLANGHQIRANLAHVLNLAARYGPPLAGIVSLALCWAPLVTVGAEAFWKPNSEGGVWTLVNFQLLFSSDQLLRALTNSITVALSVALTTAILASFLSLAVWDRSLQRWTLLLLASLALLPGDAYAISLIQLLKIVGYDGGGWTLVILAHIVWATPFAAGTLMLANLHIGEHILQAGLEYASGPFAVIYRIIWRINLGRIIGVALLAGTLSLNEYVRSFYLSGGLLTISNEVHGRLTAGFLPQNRGLFAAELIIVVISILTVLFMLSTLTLLHSSEDSSS